MLCIRPILLMMDAVFLHRALCRHVDTVAATLLQRRAQADDPAVCYLHPFPDGGGHQHQTSVVLGPESAMNCIVFFCSPSYCAMFHCIH